MNIGDIKELEVDGRHCCEMCMEYIIDSVKCYCGGDCETIFYSKDYRYVCDVCGAEFIELDEKSDLGEFLFERTK